MTTIALGNNAYWAYSYPLEPSYPLAIVHHGRIFSSKEHPLLEGRLVWAAFDGTVDLGDRPLRCLRDDRQSTLFILLKKGGC
jgi:hypothetical protein